jgi:hypothetical protein
MVCLLFSIVGAHESCIRNILQVAPFIVWSTLFFLYSNAVTPLRKSKDSQNSHVTVFDSIFLLFQNSEYSEQ